MPASSGKNNGLNSEFYRALFKDSPDAMYVNDKNGHILAANRAACYLQGVEYDKLTGMNIRSLVPAGKVDKMLGRNRLWFTGKIKDLKGVVYSDSGTVIPVECCGKLVQSGSEQVLLVILRELPPLKTGASENRLEKPFFENIFKLVPEAIVITDNRFRIRKINDQFTALFGYTADEVQGKTTSSILIPPGETEESRIFHAAIKNGRSVINETTRMKKDGSLITVCIVGAPVAIDGETAGMVKIYRNITGHKKTREALMESQEKLKNIFQNSPDAIALTTLDGIVVDRNNAALELFKFQVGFKDTHFSYLNVVAREDHKRARSFLKAVIKKGNIKNKTFNLVKKNGSGFMAEVSASMLKNKHNRPIYLIIIVKDITERLIYERKLKEAREKAIESDKLKSAFLANMSHEIRTPMNAIIGFSKLLSSTNAAEPDNNEFIEIIKNTGNTLLNLIDDIIDFAKIEAGEVTIHQSACDVHKILKELYTFFEKERVQNRKDKIELVLNIPQNEQGMVILTDQNRLRQVFSNLLGNAMKFTRKGKIEFGYSIEGTRLIFYVSDSGIGIPADKQKIIFERFRQADFNSSGKAAGTGLGLAISMNLVKLLGGSIMVESRKGEGSVFRFDLPLVKLNYPQKPGMKQLPDVNINNWKGKVILIVEDNDLNSKLLQKMIEPTGAEIISVNDGKPAVEACLSNPNIDLVLMDIQMPEMDGYEATRAIKSFRPEIPVIAQTAYAMAEEKERIIVAGCNDYISKPIRQKDLYMLLSKYLNQ
jgi:PAS domain S-box-containing protein